MPDDLIGVYHVQRVSPRRWMTIDGLDAVSPGHRTFGLVEFDVSRARTRIAAMQQAARRIHAARSIEPLESEIVPVEEVFRLQDAGELEKAEKRYLPERR